MGKSSNQDPPHGDYSRQVRKEDILHLLDSEIGQITSEQTQPGWSVWAILGSLAGIAWLILSVVETGSVRSANIAPLVLVISLLFDSLISLRSLNPRYGPYRRKRDGFFGLGDNRLEILFQIARYSFLFHLCLSTSENVWWPEILVLCFICGIGVLLMFLQLMASLTRRPWLLLPSLSIFQKPMFRVLFLPLVLLSVYGRFSALLARPAPPTVSDYRLSSLIVIAIYLILLLINGIKGHPLLSSLIQIRRDLALGRTDIVTASSQIEIALAGIQADVLQEDIYIILRLLEIVNTEYHKVISEISVLRESLPQDGAVLSEEQKDMVLQVCQSCRQHIEQATKNLNLLHIQYEVFQRAIKWMTSHSTEAAFPLLQISRKVQLASQDSKMKSIESKSHVEWLGRLKASINAGEGRQAKRDDS